MPQTRPSQAVPPPEGLPEGLSFWHPAALLATWFGTGLLPRAPGTWGSLAALPIAWLVLERAGPAALVGLSVVLFFLGLWASGIYIRHSRSSDPGTIVIDEVAAQMLVLVPAGLDPVAFMLGFLMFRTFDIMKPWPISLAERRLPGALGVMADDILAALYAAIIIGIYFMLSGKSGESIVLF